MRTYKLKLYANKNKQLELDKLLAFWSDEVNKKIKIFWNLQKVIGTRPPNEHRLGGRLISDASVKAWQIVKGAKKIEQRDMPIFKGNEIDLHKNSCKIINDFKTEEFDIWFNCISIKKRKRLKLQAKTYKKFNKILSSGTLSKSFKIIKIGSTYFIECYVNLPEKPVKKNKVIGIDVGLRNPIVLSTGEFYGNDLRDLRIRTKWRNYKGKISPYKQGINKIAKEIVSKYNDSNFAVEKLLFKGKRKRSKKYRRNNRNWAYNHLTKKLKLLSELEGFQVFETNPKNTSIECPKCHYVDKANRKNDKFLCKKCEFTSHADYVGARNVCERVIKDNPYLKPVLVNKCL